MYKFYKLTLVIAGVLLWNTITFGQVTTSSIEGLVRDTDNEPLPGITVMAIHEPSGTQYGVATREDGRYNLPNVRVGGPYSITVSGVGFKTKTQEEIFLSLGQSTRLDFVLESENVQLKEIVISGEKDELLSAERTGAATSVSTKQLESLPTIARSAQDFTRLTPQSSGNSFGGRNVLYNNFSLDGSIFNNSFGLDAPTPGGQTNAQPVSLDAIEQIQVSLAPYDVRQSGFTGAGVNAVTKSGSNEVSGSIYTFTRNENFIGEKIGNTTVTNPNLSYNQSGFRIGGPIMENTMFFFANAEIERRKEPGSNYLASRDNLSGSNVSNVLASDLDTVASILRNVYGYEPGAYENYTHQTYNDKFLLKLDWNMNEENSFSIRYNYLKSFRDVLPHPAISETGRGPDINTLPFENTSYIINNNLNSIVAELNSRFGNMFSNNFQIGYTAFRDFRESKSKPFPSIDILKDGKNYISFGLERFSTHNLLDQDVFQVTDNFTIYMPEHVVTIGTNFELFKFLNSFNLFYYPGPLYTSLDDFKKASIPGDTNFVDYNKQVEDANKNPFIMDEVNVAQFALYAQDEWQTSPDLKVTVGLRMDMPIYLTTPPKNNEIYSLNFNDETGATKKVDVGKLPNPSPLFSPRIGINWDVNGDRSMQLRGGTGIFTGRIPFVWIGNQISNGKIFPGGTYQINGTVDKFKFPQVWRTNFAIDKELPWDMVGTLEAIYSKDINAVIHRNYNMRLPSQTSKGADTRPIFDSTDVRIYSFLDAGAIMLDNTNEGYQYSITAQLRKNFDFGLTTNLAYTYSQSKDITSNPGEIASDAFQRNLVVGNPNTPTLSWSDYGLRNRVIGAISYDVEYAEHFGTTISLFFEAADGNRFSYVYAGDMNGDGIGRNDLMYVPKDETEINLVPVDANDTRTTAELWQQLNAYIEQDDYLKSRRGNYAERNGAVLPWSTKIDLRILQNFYLMLGEKRNTFQLSIDILNVGNLLNSEWGVRGTVNTKNPLTFVKYENGEPVFSFPLSGGKPLTKTFSDDVTLASRWQAQIGLRYIFN